MYASHMCAGSVDIFQSALDQLLKKNSLPSFSIGVCPSVPPIGITPTSSNPYPDCSNPASPRNNMTAASATSVTPTHVVNFVASKISEVPAADVSFAVSSF